MFNRACAACCLFCFFCVTLASSAIPSLEALGVSPSNTIQLRLHGQDSNTYQVVISTNLLSWDPWLSLSPTNGVALFSHDLAATNVLFFKVITNEVIQFQSSPVLRVESLVTADGGIAELDTPDFRHITLSIPPGCVDDPQVFSMSLVTNLADFPFSQGAFGGVTLEPEDFTLIGAASLTIEYPADVDTRQIVSFSANNDGSTFHLVLDEISTNATIIPVMRFATYGSGLATPSELNAYLNPSDDQLQSVPSSNAPPPGPRGSTPRPKGLTSQCASDPPSYDPADSLSFPPSCYQCFNPLVQRALAVRAELRQFQRCMIDKTLVETVLPERQAQLMGEHENDDGPTSIAQALLDICPSYSAKIAPLWAEANDNCALTIVLLQFSLGFERQMELLGTNRPECAFSLSENQVNACLGAHECLREIQECCNEGFKGQQKVAEALAVARVVDLSGVSCFTDDNPFSDPEMQMVIEACVTNAWIGTLTVKQQGSQSSFTNSTISTTTTTLSTEASMDVEYHGVAWLSEEIPDFIVSIITSGTLATKLHQRQVATAEYACNPDFPERGKTVYSLTSLDTVGLTNYTSGVSSNAFITTYGGYGFGFYPDATNKTYLLQTVSTQEYGGSAGDLQATERALIRGQTTLCNGGVSDTLESGSNIVFVATWPYIDPSDPPLAPFPMSDSNVISGSMDSTTSNTTYGTITTHFDWNFHRNTNAFFSH